MDYPPHGRIAPRLKPRGLGRTVLEGLEQRPDCFPLASEHRTAVQGPALRCASAHLRIRGPRHTLCIQRLGWPGVAFGVGTGQALGLELPKVARGKMPRGLELKRLEEKAAKDREYNNARSKARKETFKAAGKSAY